MKKLIALMWILLASSPLFAGASRPNVVFILLDDISHYGISAYGAEKIGSTEGFFEDVEFETPRIDSLARDGMRCDYAYAYPLCEPTRIALMSGKNNIRNYHKPKAQHASDITFGDLFQRAGYETCIVGKWKQTRGTHAIPGKDYIFEFGWDEFYCFDVITEMRRMIDPNLVINGKVVNTAGIDPDTGRRWYGPDVFNRYALDFIERNRDKPFFLYYSMVLVHDEHTPTPDTRPESIFDNHDMLNKTDYGHMLGDDRRYFPDMLAYMDKMVGKVLDKLDELDLSRNTLVVVMGDNGTKECFTHILKDGTVFKGDKGSNKEGGLHVPLLLRYPGQVPAGSTYAGMVNLTDILPTICEVAGIAHPNPESLDGISFWPQATSKSHAEHRDAIYTWSNDNRESTDTDNLIRYAFTKDFKRYAPCRLYPQGRFFDLRTDPFETEGKDKKKRPKVWNKWLHSGLELDKLTLEQRRAYDALGKVLEKHAYVAVKSLSISKPEGMLRSGNTTQLHCKVFPANATRSGVIWESSNPAIATVDKFGTVTAHRPGEVEISAYSWDDAMPLATPEREEYSRDGISSSVKMRIRR